MSRENNKEEKGGRRGGRETASGDKKKDSYKAKRSFTRNKTFRSAQSAEGRPARGKSEGGEKRFSSKGDRPWKSKPGESRGKFGDKPGRDERPKPRGERAPRETKEDREQKYQKRLDETGSGERRERKDSGFERSRKPDFDTDRPRREKDDRFGGKTTGREREERGPRSSDREGNDRGAGREKRTTDDGEKRRKFKPRNDDRKPARDGDERAPRYDREKRSDRDRGDFKPGARSSKSGDAGGRRVKHSDFEEGKAFSKQERSEKPVKPISKNADGLIRLNKYLSNAGIASRREADNLILGGTVKVNGVVVDQLGAKIKETDKVTYGDSAVKSERKVYLLLNKPKDYITTVDDPRERKTVMELITGACRERVYPVGRLDRNTTGLLLFTNDGELTTKLTHPKFGIKKVYHVSLNKGLKPDDFKAIIEGIELEDGLIKADDLAFVGEGKKEVGIEVHSGRNRIVRRIFEHLGYDVLKLDRVVFAGLTKKDLPRGKYRFLTAREISFLQMIG